jgi:hypothetical protein
MPDLDLRAVLTSVAPDPDVPAALAEVHARHDRRRRRRRMLIGVAATALVGAIAAGALLGDGDEAGERVHTSDRAADGPWTVEWQDVSAPAVPSDFQARLSFWTGEEAIWWGITDWQQRSTAQPRGFAHEPTDGSWREVATLPSPPREAAAEVWTGDELVIWGGYDAEVGMPATGATYPTDGQAYDPDTDTWRTMSPTPIESRDQAGAVWTGEEVIVFGGGVQDGPPECPDRETCLEQGLIGLPGRRNLIDAAAYDPERDSWRLLPDAPGPLLVDGTGWSGTGARFLGQGQGARAGYEVDPASGRWVALPPPPAEWNAVTGDTVGSSTFFQPVRDLPGERPSLQVLGPEGTWTAYERAQSGRCRGGVSGAAEIGHLVLLTGSGCGLYDPRRTELVAAPAPPAAEASPPVATGADVLVLTRSGLGATTSLATGRLVATETTPDVAATLPDDSAPFASPSPSPPSTTPPPGAPRTLPVAEPNPARVGEQLYLFGSTGCTHSTLVFASPDGSIEEDQFESGGSGTTYFFQPEDLHELGAHHLILQCDGGGVAEPQVLEVIVEPGDARPEFQQGALGRPMDEPIGD